MREHPEDWIETLSQMPSFRRMYAVAEAVADCNPIAPEARSAAKRVVRTLRDVIDLPVADARILAKGRKQFLKLRRLLLADECDPNLM